MEAIVIIVATDGASARAELDADYTPQFIRVARVVRDRITDGTYPRLSLVPGSRALAGELHVSPDVVLHALTILVRAGYLRHIESKPHQVIWDGDPGAAKAEAPYLAGGGLTLSAS
jgi:DNA-binding transcriptional regulator YhcF (GntR family)